MTFTTIQWILLIAGALVVLALGRIGRACERVAQAAEASQLATNSIREILIDIRGAIQNLHEDHEWDRIPHKPIA